MSIASVRARFDRLSAPVTRKPLVIFQSDDWGRVGTFDPASIGRLGAYGLGQSLWDWYGVESPDDLVLLADVLASFVDVRGRKARFTANFVLTNPDLRRMREEGYTELRVCPITEGLPAPWSQEGLHDLYLDLIAQGVFYPALHGYTHFCEEEFLSACRETSSARAPLLQALLAEDISSAARLTPEYNFALMHRRGGMDVFIDEAAQRQWVEKGVDLFKQAFGAKPRSTCAPGYRCNAVTARLWSARGIEVVQTADSRRLGRWQGLLNIARNTFFEPLLYGPGNVESAMAQAHAAVEQRKPIVVCSHSINYISRHHGRAQEGRRGPAAVFDAADGRFSGSDIYRRRRVGGFVRCDRQQMV